MQAYKREFIDLSLELGVLRFGEFRLKSGRVSPYFFNAGLFNTGGSLARLGRYYARAIADSGIEFDVLYGPAYKGIPLAAVTAAALYDQHDRDVAYAFNRKEAKDHGEGGNIVGAPLAGRVLIVDDHEINLQILHGQVSAWGMRDELANSVDQALALLRKAEENRDPFKLLLLDWHMPEKDGFDLVREIKADDSLLLPPTIMLSSTGSDQDVRQSHELGIFKHLIKPVRQQQLKDCLYEALGHRLSGDDDALDMPDRQAVKCFLSKSPSAKTLA